MPADDRERPDDEREHPGERDRPLRAARRQGQDDRRDDRPERRVGSQDEVPRRPEGRVGEQADDRRVEPGDRGQAGQLRVRHALRHEQRREDDGGDEVARQPAPLVRPDDAQARHEPLDARRWDARRHARRGADRRPSAPVPSRGAP